MVVLARCGVVSREFPIALIYPYLVEDGFGLTTITALLAVITTLSLGEQRGLSSLVLCDLVLCVCQNSVFGVGRCDRERLTLLAVLALAVGAASLRYVDLRRLLATDSNQECLCVASIKSFPIYLSSTWMSGVVAARSRIRYAIDSIVQALERLRRVSKIGQTVTS